MKYDVVVVGAGPSGSLAALVLARSGKSVALLDRSSFPRPKVCGNCLNPRAWKIWEKLDLTEAFEALPHHAVSGMAVHCEDRLLYRHAFAPRRGPRAVGREVFDDWLRREAEAAGAEFFPETTVTALGDDGTVETSRGTFSGRLVFGADGRNSVVARLAGLMPPPQRCHRVGWQTSMSPGPEMDHDVHMYLHEDGYFGCSRFTADFPDAEWMRMNPISRGRARLGAGRVWLLGDSARVVEPFTGEGIYFALATALLAAETAQAGLEKNDLDAALKIYARSHGSLYRRRAWVNALVHAALVAPGRTVSILRALRHLPPGTSFLVDQVHAG